MTHIATADANAWADGNKLIVIELDPDLEDSIATTLLGQISSAYNVSTWVDSSSTPPLLRKIIAMKYMGWFYDRVYSEDSDPSNYGALLRAEADKLIQGLISGSVVIPGLPDGTNLGLGSVSFYPTDDSSASCPTIYDTSLGDAKFSMGRIF